MNRVAKQVETSLQITRDDLTNDERVLQYSQSKQKHM